jgi:exosortase E/protease (VPEID-CTERM system)
MIADGPAWRDFVRRNWRVLGALALLGLMTPELARLIAPLWQIEAVTDFTFRAVVALLEVAGYEVTADPGPKMIGSGDFTVMVSSACSGIEGFALITTFLVIYMALFRRDIAFPAAFLLFPIGIALSWMLNVIRIAVLLAIGIEGAPDLAVGGFHSRAGWLAFTILAFALIFAARQIPAFRREVRARPATASVPAPPPFFRDPVAAAILPFAAFMLSAHVAATVSETPDLLYPWRALAMAASLALFWPVLRALPWRIDPVAAAAGLAIGAAWVATTPAAEGAPPFAALSGAAAGLWIVARVIGTGFLVPVIEELFFRGYLVGRLAPVRPEVRADWRVAAAILVSAGLFAAFHDRWFAAFLSGLVFGALFARSRRVTDAIVAHAAANLAIAAWALSTGDWSVI